VVVGSGRAAGSVPATSYLRAAAGMRTLAGWYDWSPCQKTYEPWVWFGLCHTGSFQPSAGWWNSANALTTTVNFTMLSGDPTYLGLIHHAFDSRDDGASISTNFVDDEGWWALAWIGASELDASDGERSARELARAAYVFRDMQRYWDSTCGGGVWWQKSPKFYKNAIANELFMAVAARLYQHTKNPIYLSAVRDEYRWFFEQSRLYDRGHLVVDGIKDGTCGNAIPTMNRSTWTYNQGVILGALVALQEVSGSADMRPADPRGPCIGYDVLRCAREIADIAMRRLTVQGVLTEFELAEAPEVPTPENRRPRRVHGTNAEPTDCFGPDCPQFKGIFMRNLGTLVRALPASDRETYANFLAHNAATIWQDDRWETRGKVFFGVYWQGPFSLPNATVQTSALDALVEAMALELDGAALDVDGG
jgi:predicted alpha-1,6-mannanase (GH76 family)